ncbi:MAG: beta strand repeat-containing protein, partial [Polaribacter sp.]|uniref:beta strand repeat-containing protein n=1 Tax=Polaribacter sp. TaxID=1920175 RepID=UPI003EF53545
MIKNLKRSSLLGEIARFNLVPPKRKATALKTLLFASVILLSNSKTFAQTEVVNTSTVQSSSYTVTGGSKQISIAISGGNGGNGTLAFGGQGATAIAQFNVNNGDIIRYLVAEGGRGGNNTGGGGGSTGIYINNTIVLIAGGGGGASAGFNNTGNLAGISGLGAESTLTGGSGTGILPGTGGSGGNGGTGGRGAAGGGYSTTAGGNGTANGANGGSGRNTDFSLAAGGTSITTSGAGGRGLSGGGAGITNSAGAGGGASGGGGAGTNGAAGGGGSYVDTGFSGYISSSITAGVDGINNNALQANGANGSVKITILQDTDGDGIADVNDDDDDNDGILDIVECPNFSFSKDLIISNANAGNLTVVEGGAAGSPLVTDAGPNNNEVGLRYIDQAGNPTYYRLNTQGEDYSYIDGNDLVFRIFVEDPGETFWTTTAVSNDIRIGSGGTQYTINLTEAPFGQTQPVGSDFTVSVPLTAAKFGVTQAEFDAVISSLDYIDIRAEFWLGATGVLESELVPLDSDPCDFDNDGIPNTLDSDSDNDGCSDADEAYYTGLTNPDADADDNGYYGSGTPSVDGNGRVSAPYTTPNAYYLDASVNTCNDNDNDGVPDGADLDDDNDGILDTVEINLNCPSTDYIDLGATFTNTATGTNGGNSSGTTSNLYTFEGVETTFSFETTNSVTWAGGVASAGPTGGVDGNYINVQPNNTKFPLGSYYPADAANIDVAVYKLTFTKPVHNLEFKWGGLDNDDRVDFTANLNGTNVPLTITNNTLPSNNYTIIGQSVISTNGGSNAPNNSVIVSLTGPVTEIVFVAGKNNSTNTASNVTMQLFELKYCLAADTDGDGIPNYLDLDSDGDGCFDALEGTENITTDQLTSSGAIDYLNQGGIDADGVPNAVSTGGQGQGNGTSTDKNIQSPECNTAVNTENDINQTPKDTPVDGALLTNDENVTSVTSVIINGTTTAVPTGNTGVTITNVPGVDENGVAVANAGSIIIKEDGTYTFTPTVGFTGTIDTITYTGEGANNITDTATLNIEVVPNILSNGNNPPTAQDDVATTELNTTVSSTLLSNDSDPDSDALTVTSNDVTIGTATTVSGIDEDGAVVTNAGTVQLNSDGTYEFIPATGFTGTINDITYTVSDGNGGTDTAILNLNVITNFGNNTFANDDANSAPQGTDMTGNVLTNDFDPDLNDTQTVSSASVNGTTINIGTATVIPNVGTLTLNLNGTYTFVPLDTFTGTIPVKYEICDTGSPQKCDEATLYLTSIPTDVTAENDINQTPKDTTVDGDLLTNDEGITSIKATGFVLGTPTTVAGVDENGTVVANAGSLTLNGNGTYSFTPTTGFTGTIDPVTYLGTGAGIGTDTATLSIEVLPNIQPAGNNPPTAQNDVNTTEINTTVNSTILSNDS